MHASQGFVHFLGPRTKCSSLSSSGCFLSSVLFALLKYGVHFKCRIWSFLDICDRSVQNKGSCRVGGEETVSY